MREPVTDLPTSGRVPSYAAQSQCAPPLPPRDVGADGEASADALLARVAARLRPVCRPMSATAFEALVQAVVLDTARYALGWAEG